MPLSFRFSNPRFPEETVGLLRFNSQIDRVSERAGINLLAGISREAMRSLKLAAAGHMGYRSSMNATDTAYSHLSRQREILSFAGVIYAHQLEITVGRCVRDLAIIAKATDPADIRNRVEFLPL